MSFLSLLRNVNNSLSNKMFTRGIPSYERQLKFLQAFSEPKNDMERSFFQYRCQAFSCESALGLFLRNIFSFFMIPVFLHKKYEKPVVADAALHPRLYISVGSHTDMMPDELLKQPDFLCIPYEDKMYLDEEDISFIKALRRKYPFNGYFVYKTMLKIAIYSWVIKAYQPKEIVVNGEMSFTSSLLTQYCEQKNIIHTTVMHGEKVFWIRDAFFRFNKAYMWSEYHVRLCKSMRATESEYVIAVPRGIRMDLSEVTVNEEYAHDYTFYLGFETKNTIEALKQVVDRLEKCNKKVKIRPHPAYTDMDLLHSYFRDGQIENYKEVNIPCSVASAEYTVAIYSTLLRQALNCGKKVIVDDMTNPRKYEEMKNLKFWLYETEHVLLSDELKRLEENNL